MRLASVLPVFCSLFGLALAESKNAAELAKIKVAFPNRDSQYMFRIKKGLKALSEQGGQPVVKKEEFEFEGENQDSTTAFEDEILAANKHLSEYLHEGDILLTPSDVNRMLSGRSKRNTLNGELDPSVRWEIDRPIPYRFLRSIGPQTAQLIRKALKVWENNTCLQFQENGYAKGTTEIIFYDGSGCFSSVGKQYNSLNQTISIGPGCSFMNIVHEIGHTLGMNHAHTRIDRDEYVYIYQDRIDPGIYKLNFQKQNRSSNYNYGVRYDYGSIMHYAPTAFAKVEGQTTIVARKDSQNNLKTMGQRTDFAFSDFWLINLHHKCIDKCVTYKTNCTNGYPDPKNCWKCKCPAGFSGRFCNQRDQGDDTRNCGKIVVAKSKPQTLSGTIGRNIHAEFPEMRCYFHINAPKGRRIRVTLKSITSPQCDSRCNYGHTEFKMGDPRYHGFRFCCWSDPKNQWFDSEKNQVVISMRSAWHYQGFVVEYQMI
ncbi:hypothetical protein L596_013032 [Steinernema carpocapsae]|uniref:Zinc metalloproteinase n=1 Tax=Steinernema carpocapsae TaxID=34508 RepID=A0A4U5NZ11_STECR|nr:hypothetical protein L596_013032 [Steinernema carpocapsae]